ncbi:MAG: OmpA family protein [Parvibaculum sp.]|nr:OmpA family protein [Parvibaculum sp.]|tara:strand:+ start:1520 stop:2131 length:612 start_codon:yes stop_codon:yes gene_type:complete
MTALIQTADHRTFHIFRHFVFATGVTIALLAGAAGTAHAASENEPVDAAPLDIPGDPGHSMRFDNADDPKPGNDPLNLLTPTPPAPAADTLLAPSELPTPETAILRIFFSSDSSTLDDQSIADISAFAISFKERGGRVRLRGYAGPPGSSNSNMRRLSLRRVLVVRDYLLAQDISADRITVQALGGVRDSGPRDRVDILKPGR